ncbi:MAG: hypothetical protein ACK56F_27095, partial [bacterium]
MLGARFLSSPSPRTISGTSYYLMSRRRAYLCCRRYPLKIHPAHCWFFMIAVAPQQFFRIGLTTVST